MNLIDKASYNIALFIRKNNPDAGSETALKYTLSLLINTFSAITISLIICSISGHLTNSIIVALVWLAIRYVSGGFHLNSSISCCVFSIFIIVTISHLNYNYSWLGFLFDILSICIVGWKAPVGLENVSRIEIKYYPLLKAIAVCLVISNFFIQSSLLSSVFFVQSLMLLRTTENFFHYIERRFSNEKANSYLS
ncbi:MAG: Accessory protein regulator [Paenibacillaceae bacterium]|nr:Accessory protein regulator [Paenibacillaceae bacterium]